MKHILSLGLLAWTTAQAVELGSVSLTSVSGEPLRAQIPIILGKGETIEQLAASVIETNPNITDLHLVLAEGPSPHINLSSKKPINLSKLGLTLQITKANEENEYHYDLTFNPRHLNTATTLDKPFTYGPVKAGETLWQVAAVFGKQYHITTDQALASLYENNKKAFAKSNKDQLLAGAYLTLPAKLAKVSAPKHPPVHFKPTDIVRQSSPVEPAAALAETSPETFPAMPAQPGIVTTMSDIPEFPEMEQGKQVAMNMSATLPGVPALKLLNPLTDVNTALFSDALTSVLNVDEKGFMKLIDTVQQDLSMARDAIDVERKAKQALQNQVNDLQIQLRALTELIALQQDRGMAIRAEQGVASLSMPSLAAGVGSNPMVLIMAAVVLASVLMYGWDRMMPAKLAPVPVAPTSRPVAKPRPTLPSLTDVDACIAQGRFYQAQEILQSLLSKQPNDFDVLYKLCQMYVKTDNRAGFESKVGRISTRWRMMFPQRFDRLRTMHQQTWGSAMTSHEDDVPVYEGDPPSDPVQTKLDLARAYIDIGDQHSAYEILEEVLKEGTAAQIVSAQVLMSQIKSS